jgi:hypothetical protein
LYVDDAATISTISATTPTTGAAYVQSNAYSRGAFEAPAYFKIVVASSTDVTYYHSKQGMAFRRIGAANRNPGFTIASFAVVVDCENATWDVELFCDWVRFTQP